MSEELLVEKCSPTMAGLKTGNLFTCPIEDKKEFVDSIRKLNKLLVPRGARILPLRYTKGRMLIYMYRPSKLKVDLSDELALKILAQRSYPVENSEKCISELIRRLNKEDDFPHEIGLFLGYPSEDVFGFIVNRSENAKCVGAWKVYGDEEKAKAKFMLYRKCTKAYCESYRKNSSFEKLVVSCS